MLGDMLYYYEVCAHRARRSQVIARVPTYALAEEISVSAQQRLHDLEVEIIRRRGLHPFRLLNIAALIFLIGALLPWFWPRVILVLLACAVQLGLMSSGAAWIRGGVDDR